MVELFQSLIEWRTLIDVSLITIAIFFLFRAIRRLGTWKILWGVLAAIVVFLIANMLDLTGVQWIYSNLSSIILITFIIIFQPELRKMLERAVFFRHFKKRQPDKTLSELIAETIFTMAQQQRGAIIVVSGRDSIQEHVSGGFILNAKPSGPLLLSIFDPHSPGHDGAVVIENGVFTHFGVRLPVSISSRLPDEYGTRHHAAMGMSEQTDALILVVSEERGRVSLFRMGSMKRISSPEEAAGAIETHWKETNAYPFEFSNQETRKSVFYQMAASLILAVSFWSTIIVAKGELVERVVTVPVEYSATAPDMALTGERESEVQLYLGGTKSKLDALDSANISVKVDLSTLKTGTQSIFITNDHIKLPKGVKLFEVIPSDIELTIAAIEEQMAIVSAQLVGELQQGLVIDSIRINPERVRVISPAREGTEKILQVTTTPIYLEGINKDTTILCKIIAPQTIQPADKRWPDVEVSINVGKKQPLK